MLTMIKCILLVYLPPAMVFYFLYGEVPPKVLVSSTCLAVVFTMTTFAYFTLPSGHSVIVRTEGEEYKRPSVFKEKAWGYIIILVLILWLTAPIWGMR